MVVRDFDPESSLFRAWYFFSYFLSIVLNFKPPIIAGFIGLAQRTSQEVPLEVLKMMLVKLSFSDCSVASKDRKIPRI